MGIDAAVGRISGAKPRVIRRHRWRDGGAVLVVSAGVTVWRFGGLAVLTMPLVVSDYAAAPLIRPTRLFAQELRTPMPVSAKRLQKVWESMQR